jgi:hypothetical protein
VGLAYGSIQSPRNIPWLQIELYWYYIIWISIANFIGNKVDSSSKRVGNALHFFALVQVSDIMPDVDKLVQLPSSQLCQS